MKTGMQMTRAAQKPQTYADLSASIIFFSVISVLFFPLGQLNCGNPRHLHRCVIIEHHAYIVLNRAV